jgi:carboxymethylenebutenolidase
MPIYDPDHVEYSVTSGHVQIVLDGGGHLPAYWAHPLLGSNFPGVVLIHDWWGMTDIVRLLANLFAQMGHYVIAPDLFSGKTTTSPQEALKLVEALEENGYPPVHQALTVLENHHHCNRSVAAVGIGMGGSLAYEAAIVRDDLEAAVSYGGFPQRYLGRFKDANTPILAFYGEKEPHIKPEVIKKLRSELASSAHNLPHRVEIIPDLEHEFFSTTFNDLQRERSRSVLKESFAFLDSHLEGPTRHSQRPVY